MSSSTTMKIIAPAAMLRSTGITTPPRVFSAEASATPRRADTGSAREKGNYNPFLADQSAGPEQIENAIGTLYLTIAEAAKTFELLELKRFEPILANILYQGMKETVDSIVSKKEKTI